VKGAILDARLDEPRDQEAGDDEEHIDADESAAGERKAGVEEQDREDRQGSQPIDIRPVSMHATVLRLQS
jgi:hypothetical protein